MTVQNIISVATKLDAFEPSATVVIQGPRDAITRAHARTVAKRELKVGRVALVTAMSRHTHPLGLHTTYVFRPVRANLSRINESYRHKQ